MRRIRIILVVHLIALTAFGCDAVNPASPSNLRRPMDMAFFCVEGPSCVPPVVLAETCDHKSTETTLCTLVTNGELGDLALINIRTQKTVDTDPFIPGFTRHPVGGVPLDVVISPDQTGIYISNPGLTTAQDNDLPAIDRLDTTNILTPLKRQSLPAAGRTLVYLPGNDGDILLATAPDRNGVWRVPIDDFGNHDATSLEAMMIQLEGPPSDIAIRQTEESGDWAYVVYHDRARLSVVHLDSGEITTLTLSGQCNDGVDNDEDGLTDLLDEDCESWDSPGENIVDCPEGVDSPTCEIGGESIPTFSRIALSTDGRFAYVTSRPHRQVFVIRTDTHTLIDVNLRPGSLGNPMHAAAHQRGIVLSSPPQAVEFATTTVDEKPLETAYVSTTIGILHAIDAFHGETDLHLLRASHETNSAISIPELFQEGIQIEQSFVARSDYPNLGPFTVDADAGIYYGVTLGGSPRVELTETWSVTHQGVLPGTNRHTGALQEASNETGEKQFTFQDSSTDFCARGVEPGDTLVLYPPEQITCGNPEEPNTYFHGDRFEYRILKAQRNTLTLDPLGGIGVTVLTEEKIPGQSSEEILAAPPPSGDCLTELDRIEIRVPAGVYSVVGSRSGFLHPWTHSGQTCVVSTDDPLRIGRAHESVPSQNPEGCILPMDDAYFEEEVPFQNPVFSFQIRPGCITTNGGSSFADTDREVELRFSVSSGFTPAVVAVGAILRKIRNNAIDARLYLIDEQRNNIQTLDPSTLEITSTID